MAHIFSSVSGSIFFWRMAHIFLDVRIDSKGEFLITLLGSLAQEESSNISQITKMGIAYRFQEGKVIVNHNRFLGYTKDDMGDLVIVPEEAEIIRRIYKEFLEGKSPFKIAAVLERDGKITGSGGSRWYDSTVNKILKNEKYMGEALLQKTYTVDFLNKKRVKNNGQAAQYYVENSHPPIVSKDEFAAVQAEFERRTNMRGYSKTGKSKFTSDYAFSGKLFCGNCGSKFRRTKWGKGKNQQIVWICINHQITGDCDMKAVKEKAVEQAFLRVMNRLIGSKDAFIPKEVEKIEGEERLVELQTRIEELQSQMMSLAKTGLDEKEYSALAGELDLLRDRMQRLKGQETERVLFWKHVQELRDYLMAQESEISKFDEDLFRRFVERVRVRSMVEVEFVFKTGVEVREVL